MEKKVKVGVFDSGLGGLTVAIEIFKQLPWVSVIYFGDTARIPYGDKTVEQLKQYGKEICDFFIDQGVVGIVAACNTSSSVSLDFLQAKYTQLPVIGVVEPGVQLAIEKTKKKKIGVVATAATVKSKAHEIVLNQLTNEVEIYAQSCPKFVPLVEKGEINSLAVEKAAAEYITPLLQHNIDSLILGCTHYPFLKDAICKVTADKIELIDPAQTTVNILAKKLAEIGYNNADQVEHCFYVSGDPQAFLQVGQRLIGNHNLKDVVKKDLAGLGRTW